MSLKSEINKLISDIIDEECKKSKPEIKEIINAALFREMCSASSKDLKNKVNADYDAIVSKILVTGDDK